MHNFRSQNLKFKHFIDNITINFLSFWNFANIKNIRKKYNLIIEFSNSHPIKIKEIWRFGEKHFSFQMRQWVIYIMTRSTNWSYHVLVKVVSVRLSSYTLMWVYDYVTRNFIDYNILTSPFNSPSYFLNQKKKLT